MKAKGATRLSAFCHTGDEREPLFNNGPAVPTVSNLPEGKRQRPSRSKMRDYPPGTLPRANTIQIKSKAKILAYRYRSIALRLTLFPESRAFCLLLFR